MGALKKAGSWQRALSLVRVCAICFGVLSALESSWKERALSIKGRQQRSLSLFSAPSCIEWVEALGP